MNTVQPGLWYTHQVQKSLEYRTTGSGNITITTVDQDLVLPMHRNYDEKRNFIRMKVDTSVTFTKIDAKERYEARCRNLSGTGMLLETEKKLTLGDRLRVTVPSEGPNFAPLDAIVEVVRVDAMPSMHKFMIGVIIRQIEN